jgi:hypothetical protein
VRLGHIDAADRAVRWHLADSAQDALIAALRIFHIMSPLQIHASLANAVILFNTILGVWGLIKFLRGEGLDGNYLGAVALSPLLGLVQVIVGLVLVGLGLGVMVRFVHYLYGVLVVISAPAVFAYTRGRDDRGAVLLYGATLLLTAAFGWRAQMTGYEIDLAF